jgi:hypothetical protein
MKVETSGAIAKIAQAVTQYRKFDISMLVQDGELFSEIVIVCSKHVQLVEVRLKEAPGYMHGATTTCLHLRRHSVRHAHI